MPPQRERTNMKPINRTATQALFLLSLAGFVLVAQAAGKPQEIQMAGYLLVPHRYSPQSYNAGFSMYTAVWPLFHGFDAQPVDSGSFGTWMWAQRDDSSEPKFYADIEGGVGRSKGRHFETETPKFSMGGVGLDFSEWANGPGKGKGSGKGLEWSQPKGQYGVAQLSPWLVWPLDGLNFKQDSQGELFGYGYLPLPLTRAKATTAGRNVPTGDQSWTLFVNTGNFKGPVAFFTPYYWSHFSLQRPDLAGMFLDSRGSNPNKALQMETHHIPALRATDARGEVYAKLAPLSFPRNENGDAVVVHRLSVFDRSALWEPVKAWLEGGAPASGLVGPQGTAEQTFGGGGQSTWKIFAPNTPKEDRVPIAWNSFATPTAFDDITYGYRWNPALVSKDPDAATQLSRLPQYFHLTRNAAGKPVWEVVAAADVPFDTGLVQAQFKNKPRESSEPFVTPQEPQSVWKKPGPVAGPFQVRLGDGSFLTYHWYRFADQPSLLNADLSPQEREDMQKRAEKLHRLWTKERAYLPPPTVGRLVDLDPALIVTPPKGLEVGYVPIATRQGLTRN
jgi:hypothetical protein